MQGFDVESEAQSECPLSSLVLIRPPLQTSHTCVIWVTVFTLVTWFSVNVFSKTDKRGNIDNLPLFMLTF